MELKNLSDEQVEKNLIVLVEKERTQLTEILSHIIEVDERKIYLKRSYRSLHDYCEKVLKYPGDQAYRRIAAAQILRDCPAIKSELDSGRLNITQLGQAKCFFNHQAQKDEPLNANDKILFLSTLTGKSTRESEKIIADLSPEAVKKDKVKVITGNLTEIRFIANDALMNKIQKFKDLDSHKLKNSNYNDLFERLVDLAIAEKEKKLKGSESRPARPNANVTESPVSAPRKANYVLIKRFRAIPTRIKREVYRRDQGCCTFTDPLTGRKCESKQRIQYDHLHPFSLDGEHTLENLTLRCQSHNLFSAEQVFGREKMRSFKKMH